MASAIDAKKVRVKPSAAPIENQAEEAEVQDDRVKLPLVLREDIPLSVEEAKKMQQILDDPNHPSYVGKEMPTADASVLRKKPN